MESDNGPKLSNYSTQLFKIMSVNNVRCSFLIQMISLNDTFDSFRLIERVLLKQIQLFLFSKDHQNSHF